MTLSDWAECAGCHNRFYVGFIPAERWRFKGLNGELYCSPECRKFAMNREDYQTLKQQIRDEDVRRTKEAQNVLAAGTDQIAEKTERAAVKLKTAKMSTHERTERRKADGLCIHCGKVNDNPNGLDCLACNAKQRKRMAELRIRRISQGICEVCGKPVEPDKNGKRKRRCAACRDRANLLVRQRKEKKREGG